MKSIRRILALILVTAMTMGLLPTVTIVHAATEPFSDTQGHWAKTQIEELVAKNVISGMGDGTYNPNGIVTRGQFMKLVVAVQTPTPQNKTDAFSDVPADSWVNPYVAEGLSSGIFSLAEISGNNFANEAAIDRDTAALWIARAAGIVGADSSTTFADDASIKNKGAVAAAVTHNIISGYEDNTFRPQNTLTRAEAAVLIHRLMANISGVSLSSGASANTGAAVNAGAADTAALEPIVPHNDIVLQKDVQKLEPAANVNVLVRSDESTGYYLFENIDDSLRNLQPEQVFVIYPCSSVPEGVAIKVKEIKINGNNAEVWDSGVTLGDVVEKMDSAGIYEISIADIEFADDLPEGMTITSASGQSISQIKQMKEDGVLLADVNDGSFSLGSGLKITYAEVELDGIKVSGSSNFNPKFVYKIDYDFWRDWLNPKEVTAYIQNDKTTHNFTVTKFESANNSKSKEVKVLKVGDIKTPLGTTGFTVYGSLYMSVDLKGEVSVTVKYETFEKAGFTYKNGTTKEVKESDETLSGELEVEGTLKIGPKFELGVSFLKVMKVEVSASIGFGVKGTLENSIGLTLSDVKKEMENSTKRYLTGAEGVVNMTTINHAGEITEVHDCAVCIDGDIFLYLDVGFEVKLEAGPAKASFLKTEWEIWNEKNMKIADFYYSFHFDRGQEFVLFSDCPHIYKIPEITKQPKSQTTGVGKAASFSITAVNKSDNKLSKFAIPIVAGFSGNENADSLTYAWYKVGDDDKAISGVKDFKISATSMEDNGEYYCVVYIANCPQVSKKSAIVTLTVTEAPLPQVDANFQATPAFTINPDNFNNNAFEVITPKFE